MYHLYHLAVRLALPVLPMVDRQDSLVDIHTCTTALGNPACPVHPMWDGQDSPVDIHTYTTSLVSVLPVLSFTCGMGRTVPWTYTHVYHCTWQSYPSHVGRTALSRGHTHMYHCTCPVLPMWDGQDSPVDIHTCTTALAFSCGMDSTVPWTYTHVPLQLASPTCPVLPTWDGQHYQPQRVMSKFAITSPMSTRDCPHCPWVEMTVNWTIDILDYVTGIGNEIA